MANKNAKGRVPKHTPEIDAQIIDIKKNHQNRSAKDIHDELFRRAVRTKRNAMTKSAQEQQPDWSSQRAYTDLVAPKLKEINEDVKKRLPGESSITKFLANNKPKITELINNPNPLDKPWSIAASIQYGLPPEANRDLFYLWRVSLALGRPLSIRQAKWIVHLRNVRPEELPQKTYSEKVRRSLWLISQSWLYSIREQVSEIMAEKPFETTDLDAASFMNPWEYATAIELGNVKPLIFSEESISRLENNKVSITSPPRSGFSVEQAVWHNVRAEPSRHMEFDALGFSDEVLPEEDDLICAYWLMYLSKGPLWNNLPEQPEIQKALEYYRQERENAKGLILDSGGFPDDSLYSRQLCIRNKLREWVKKHSSMTMRDYYSLTKQPQHPALVLSPKLLTMVGYEVPLEDLKLYAKLHENELKQEHLGWDLIPAEVQQRFINDNETNEDLDLLNEADFKKKKERNKIEQEFIDLVHQKGGEPKIGANKFWQLIKEDWIGKHPEYIQTLPQAFKSEYVRIIQRLIEEGKAYIKEDKVYLNKESEGTK